jgi:REP element-mobilizing transposase RayT
MSQKLCRALFHIVITTNDRRNYIPANMLESVRKQIFEIARQHELDLLAVGGTENHMHLLLEVPPETSVAQAVRLIKTNTGRWLRESVRLFAWQDDYTAFSVSPSHINRVVKYINYQPEHHQNCSVEEELRTLLIGAGLHPESARRLRQRRIA